MPRYGVLIPWNVQLGVNTLTIDSVLKVEVASEGISGVAYLTDHVTLGHDLTCVAGTHGHMSVQSMYAVAVADEHVVAVAVMPFASYHSAAVGGIDGGTGRTSDIGRVMVACISVWKGTSAEA